MRGAAPLLLVQVRAQGLPGRRPVCVLSPGVDPGTHFLLLPCPLFCLSSFPSPVPPATSSDGGLSSVCARPPPPVSLPVTHTSHGKLGPPLPDRLHP